MFEWLDSVAGPGYAAAVLWTFAALVLLVIVLVIVKLIRSLTFGTFVAGGRNRKTRLAVMDATAVDSQRRLVLVRRDDIEHLLLIGGPTDVVIETDIRMTAPRRPALTGTEAGQQAAQPARQAAAQPTVQRPAQAPAARPQQPAPPAPVKQAPPRLPLSPTAPAAPSPAPRPAIPAGYAPPVRSSPAPAVAPMRGEEIDETLMKELEVSLDDKPQAKPAKAADPSLDDEMAKLLGELTSHKR
ncbi:Flagellar biosynthesis protein, FliO [Aminobacter sp. MSH1]|uniref:flagellar biosynthetic protein FliO n=1 Tax=Aminobacter sp. MSH1 TaxID=374606 RepID=UPI000D382BEF|nr:flagellar biosynthetic protein FliO [Aminobacter sp. MSH1]AWC24162.1 Flagellar biosynthesis protein, FliO [Aminobacter sp. MSH1]